MIYIINRQPWCSREDLSLQAGYKYIIIVLFVETPHKFITAVINLRGVSTNKTIICFIAMQTYKELIINTLFDFVHAFYQN